jgi:hypothetical protein
MVTEGLQKRHALLRPSKFNAHAGALKLRSVDNSDEFSCRDLVIGHQCCGDEPDQGTIMAKRKKGSKIRSRAKLQRRAKLRRAISAKRSKARKAAKTAKRAVARTKPKRIPVKKAARKVKQPVVAGVETVAVEVIEQPAPDVITVTEVEETEVRKAS